jgi:hypothetical protein
MSGYPGVRGHQEVKSVSNEGEANDLLAEGWDSSPSWLGEASTFTTS